jgi:hypothetical protein
MNTIKVEPNSDDETSAACAFVECQLIEQHPEQATLNKINSEYKVSFILCVLVPHIFKICKSLTLHS